MVYKMTSPDGKRRDKTEDVQGLTRSTRLIMIDLVCKRK